MKEKDMIVTNRVNTRAIDRYLVGKHEMHLIKKFLEYGHEFSERGFNILACSCFESALDIVNKMEVKTDGKRRK